MANCDRSEFQKLIEWSSAGPQGIIRHVIDVTISDHPPEGLESDNYFGILVFFAAPLALPPLWLDDILGGTAIDSTSRTHSVIITIGLSNPTIRIWLRFMKGSSERRFVALGDLECTRQDKDGIAIKGLGDDQHQYVIELTKGTEIDIPSTVGRSFG